MKKFLCIGEPYKSNGEDKIFFNRIGEMFESKAGKTYAKLYTMPGVLIHVFDEKQKAKEAPKPAPAQENFNPDSESVEF